MVGFTFKVQNTPAARELSDHSCNLEFEEPVV